MNLKKFKILLETKDTLINECETEEFFDEIFEKIEEETELFEELGEDYVWNRVSEILVYVSADALLDLKIALIFKLITCDISELESLCYYYSHNMSDTYEFYGLDPDIDLENELLLPGDDDSCSHRHFLQTIIEKEEGQKIVKPY